MIPGSFSNNYSWSDVPGRLSEVVCDKLSFRGARGGSMKKIYSPAAPVTFFTTIHLFTIIHHYSPLFTYSQLFTITHHYSPLFTIIHLFKIIHHYSPLFTIIHHYSPVFTYSPLFTIIHHYSPLFTSIHLFTIIHQYSPLFTILSSGRRKMPHCPAAKGLKHLPAAGR